MPNDTPIAETVIIYDQLNASIEFMVVPADVSHLNGAYINSSDTDDVLAEELDKLVHEYDQNGKFVRPRSMLDQFPVDAVRRGAKVIVCGFLP
jgi:hypothetical protein